MSARSAAVSVSRTKTVVTRVASAGSIFGEVVIVSWSRRRIVTSRLGELVSGLSMSWLVVRSGFVSLVMLWCRLGLGGRLLGGWLLGSLVLLGFLVLRLLVLRFSV